MRPARSLLFLVALFLTSPSGPLSGQGTGTDLGPVRVDRFRVHAAPAPWIEPAGLGLDTVHTDTVPADSSGLFLVSAGMAAVGAFAGLYFAGSTLPYGFLYMPILGAAYGAQLGDEGSGGVNPSFAAAMLGAVLGGVTGVLAPCTVAFCQGVPFTLLPGLAIGAALGIEVAYSRRAMARAGAAPAPEPPSQPDPGADGLRAAVVEAPLRSAHPGR